MKIREKLSAICGFGSRAPGSWAELKAAEYIRATLKKIGLEVVMEPFESPSHLAISSELKTVKG